MTVGIGGIDHVAHADGADLGAHPRPPEEPVLLPLHYFNRRRPPVRLRRSDHIITSWFCPGHSLGRLQGDAPSRGDPARRASKNGAIWRWACASAPGPWVCRSCRSARCSGPTCCKQRPEAKEINCPFTGEKLLLVPALNPDVALIHVQRCDPYGNAQMDGLQFMDIDLAMAANRVILTTERIVSNDQIRRAPDQTKIPFFCGRRGGRGSVRLRAARMLRRLRADDAAHGILR